MKISKYSVLAHIYFFFNAVLLPKGLLFTTLAAPVFFYRAVKAHRKTYLTGFLMFLCVYDLVHVWSGVDPSSFLISNILFLFTYFSVIGIYHFINNYTKLGKLFKELLITNALLAIVAVPFFFAPKNYQQWFWYINKLTVGFEGFPRLAMFTYEASYYSLLLIPILYYYCLKFIFNDLRYNRWLTLSMVLIPMLMSLSFGVIGATFFTVLIMCCVYMKRLFTYKRAFIIASLSVFILITTLLLLYIYLPDNAFFARIHNILSGKDTSANGRTSDSFTMAWRIADMKNIWLGAGLGQIKIMATEVVRKYYDYWGYLPRYDIPNAMGETLAIFGLLGVAFRLFLECWLFFKTRVFTNYYRLALFIFVFIYQFTGSFITNIVEYVIWILAFSNVFPQFTSTKKI